MIVKQIPAKDWAPLSLKAHRVVFREEKPSEWDRIDFALITEQDGNIGSYVTCRELSHDSLYWQYGGAFPNTKGTILSQRAFDLYLDWAKENYQRVSFLVENTNKPMLKTALRAGFLIVGVRVFKNSILLEHLLEFSHD